MCDRKINPTGACQQSQYVSYKYGWILKHSEGSCAYPEYCICKSLYFYNDGPMCTGNIRKS